MFKLSQKGIAHIALLVILVVGLIAAVFLVQKTQIFRPQADESTYFQTVSPFGKPVSTTHTKAINLKITLPPNWKMPDEKQNKLVVATDNQQCPEEAPFNGGICTANPPLPDECDQDHQWCDGGCCRLSTNDASPAPINSQEHTLYAFRIDVTNKNTGEERPLLPFIVEEILTKEGKVNPIWVSALKGKLAEDLPAAAKNTTWDITLTLYEKHNGPGVIGKSPWDLAYQEKYTTSILQTESTLSNINYNPTPADSTTVFPKMPKTEAITARNDKTQEYIVDVYIHNSFSNKGLVKDWIRNTIEYELNHQFLAAGINKQFKIGYIYTDYESTTCPSLTSDACEFRPGNKINIWLYGPGTRKDLEGGYAIPSKAQIGASLPDDPRGYTYMVVHEMGHIFAMPDYYWEYIDAANNPISGTDIFPYAKDNMFKWYEYDFYSWVSAQFANRVNTLPSIAGDLKGHEYIYTPDNVLLKLTDDNGKGMSGIFVEVFPEIKSDKPGKFRTYMGISNRNSFVGYTDEQGQFNLGSSRKMFQLNKDNILGSTALLQITKDNEVRYLPITNSYLNYLFFQGNIQQATISVPFSKLPGKGVSDFRISELEQEDQNQPILENTPYTEEILEISPQ